MTKPKVLVKDVPANHVFALRGKVFVKLGNTKRSKERPFDVNAKLYGEQYSHTVTRGWINENEKVTDLGHRKDVTANIVKNWNEFDDIEDMWAVETMGNVTVMNDVG